MPMSTLHADFVRCATEFFEDDYMPRLERALEVLPAGDLWWRPHEGVLSFGTVLLPLAGKVRQWIVCGVGGAEDRRDRAAEFAATGGAPGPELLEQLRAVVAEACAVIRGLDEADLTRTYSIQGNDVTGTYAISHVFEHFSWHTGQAVWIAKARAGAEHGVAFFDEDKVNSAHNG